MSPRCVIGTDIGGTFTDVVLTRDGGSMHVVKQLSTPAAPEQGVLSAVERVLREAGVAASEVVRVVHGTTLATNAVIERRGARVAFVTTAGFGDLLRIGREARVEDDRYDLRFEVAPPPLARECIFEVPERMDARGEVLRPLDERAAREVARGVAKLAPEAVALCFLHSWANPAHEERMREILAEALPDALIVASSRVHPEIREFDRATTTLFTAEIAPLMARYLRRLERGLRALGVNAPLHIMESSGGVMAAEVAAERAVATLESGGAAGVMAAARLAQHYGIPRVISFDMGGTTAKAGVVHDGRPRVVRELQVGGKGSFGGRRAGTGLPVKTPTIDLAEVGAGGGSIAWLDPEGLLRVGPRSAGAEPGPACYAKGGVLPTVTDANLLLGYLDPAHFAGGSFALDAAAARAAVERQIAAPLGVSAERAAFAIHEQANANMAAAIHVVTVQRGLDPREHALFAFGGAGPMHMAGVAQRFGIAAVLAPAGAGVASAIGMQATDLTAEHGRSCLLRLEQLDPARAEALFEVVERGARTKLGVGAAVLGLRIERFVELRFEGQAHELPVSLAGLGREALAGIEASFRAAYHAAYGVVCDGRVEVAALRVRLTLPVERLPLLALESGRKQVAARASRPAWFGPDAAVETAVYARQQLPPGASFEGPAIVEGAVETIVVPPRWLARVDAVGGLQLSRAGSPRGAPTAKGDAG